MALLLQTDLPNLLYRGKVRDTYRLSRDEFLLVATDRVSAFDVVLPTGIPDKGLVLNQLSAFWFERTKHLVPNHMVEVVGDVRLLDSYRSLTGCAVFPTYLNDRSMIVIKAERIDVECVIRGYLSGSAWAEYRKYGTISGKRMPEGLQESDKLPQPLFTPTTKEDDGHDKPITIEQMANLIGDDLTKEIMERSLSVYLFAEEYARGRGIIIADTKMEFGIIDGKLHLIDELLTPDSSRFWDMEKYTPGGPQPSFDKQPLRDWLEACGWNKEPPAPELPSEVVEQMAERYREAYRRLTGEEVVG
ncbi:phosphoribosylaminoimidazolesuccinocarboxamide synthase [Dehalococcoidia bacterium]|nr:phosphoribosylaminoimidazolesuccinocarboxamide synthase [Dehalococcoidia bacterium]